MPTRDSYSPGSPSWVDLSTTDPAAARAFYGELFGWTADVDKRPEAGGYTQFRRDGHALAGCGPLFVEGMPPVWSTYIASADTEPPRRRNRGSTANWWSPDRRRSHRPGR